MAAPHETREGQGRRLRETEVEILRLARDGENTEALKRASALSSGQLAAVERHLQNALTTCRNVRAWRKGRQGRIDEARHLGGEDG